MQQTLPVKRAKQQTPHKNSKEGGGKFDPMTLKQLAPAAIRRVVAQYLHQDYACLQYPLPHI
jgi:hypothetical protein